MGINEQYFTSVVGLLAAFTMFVCFVAIILADSHGYKRQDPSHGSNAGGIPVIVAGLMGWPAGCVAAMSAVLTHNLYVGGGCGVAAVAITVCFFLRSKHKEELKRAR